MEVEIWKRAQREHKDIHYVKESNGNGVIRSGEHVIKVKDSLNVANTA